MQGAANVHHYRPMFEHIVLRRSDGGNAISAGQIAQALLFYKRVHAIIEPTDANDPPGADEVRAYVKGRLLAYKVPKTIEIIDAIPRSEAMKVNRGRLVEARGG